MSYAPPRRVVPKKKKDYTAMIIVVVALIALPALGFGVYKVVMDPPTPDVAAIPPAPPTPPKRKRDHELTPTPGTQSGANPYKYEYTPPAKGQPGSASDAVFSSNYSMSTSSGSMGASTATEKACKVIQESLEVRKGLVVWLFDRSPSADTRRQDVLAALKTSYPPLISEDDKKAATTVQDAKLLTVVGAFASDAQYFTDEPVAGDEKVLKAIEEIKSGNDGNIENTFRAVSSAITKYSEYTKPPHLRNVSIIVVTDEAGNDQTQRDLVVEQAKKESIPVYVIGSAAEFGSTGSADAGPEGMASIRGPESHDVEAIKLDTGVSMGMMGAPECGIGPYALSALCKETGGEYFVVSSMGSSVQLPPAYYPKYMPERDYQAYIAGNKAMQALIAASQLPPAKQLAGAQLGFTTDETGLAKTTDIDMALRPQALIAPAINDLFDTLKKGEADRDKLMEPRQKAAFDLAYGRTMAAKVRTEGYGVLLAAFKAGRKASKEGIVSWRLEPADGIEKNSVLESMSKKAKTYLDRVKTEHPNTPWAQAAEQELSQPIGWKWVES